MSQHEKPEDETERTDHGDNIADQVQGEDAYGYSGDLTIADIWNILDNIHSQFMATDRDNRFLSDWMDQLEKKFPGVSK